MTYRPEQFGLTQQDIEEFEASERRSAANMERLRELDAELAEAFEGRRKQLAAVEQDVKQTIKRIFAA